MKMKNILLFVLIIFLASILRLWELGKPDLYGDEIHYVNDGQRLVHKDPYIAIRYHTLRHGSPSVGHPFFGQIITASIFKVLENNNYTARLAQALAGILAVGVIYLFNGKLGNNVKILGAFLLAISPFAVRFNRDAHIDSIFALLTTIVALSIWRFNGSKNKIWLITAGITAGLAISTKLDGFIALLLAIILYFSFEKISWQKVKRSLLNLNYIFFPAVIIAFFLNDPNAYIDGILRPADPAYRITSLNYWISALKAVGYYWKVLFNLLTPGLTIAWVVAVLILIKNGGSIARFLISWQILTLGLFVLHIPGVSGEYGILPAIAPMILIIAYVLNLKRYKRFRKIIILIVVLLSIPYLFWYGLRLKPVPFRDINHPANRIISDTFYQRVVKKVNEISPNDGKIFILPQGGYPLFALRTDLSWS